MHGGSSRDRYEERQARVIEAAAYGGAIGSGLFAYEETTRMLRDAAEQRRLPKEAGLDPRRLPKGVFARVGLVMLRILAAMPFARSESPSQISQPDSA